MKHIHSMTPYVMISRVTSLNGILILCLFDWNKICCRQSQDSRQEREWINILQLQTKIKHSTLTESADARQTLHRTRYTTRAYKTDTEDDVDLTFSHNDNITLIQCLQEPERHMKVCLPAHDYYLLWLTPFLPLGWTWPGPHKRKHNDIISTSIPTKRLCQWHDLSKLCHLP